MTNIIVIAIIAVIIGAAGYYVYRSKKNGNKCIGCPGGCSCSSKESSCGKSK